MSFLGKILEKKGEIFDLVRDPRLHELVTKREFRLTEEYLHREVLDRMADDEVTDLKLEIREGLAELSGKVKKRLLPFAIPFSVTFSIHSLDFSQKRRVLHLKLEEVKPVDLDAVTKRLVETVPFLSFHEGLVALDLARVPRLAELFSYDVKGVRPFDFLVLKDVAFCPGEVVGKVGVVL